MSTDQISNNKIRQVFVLGVIILLSGLILYNLSDFLPSLLGAITLYIITRNVNFRLVEGKGWKKWIAAMVIIILCLIVIILPTYFVIDVLVVKISNAKEYTDDITKFFGKIESYIRSKTGFEILSGGNMEKITGFATKASTAVLNTTVNMLSTIAAMFFILYFMLTKGRVFERILSSISPLKKANAQKIGEKFRKMVVANAVGIPVVALGQAIVAIIGYFIFGAPNPFLLFVLTFIGSMIPIVGAAIIYVPVGLFMLASGDTFGGVGVIAFGMIVVGLVDNIFRFTFLKKLENIHPLNTVFGIILGLKIFGFLGLIFGPILVSITILLMQIYIDEFSDETSNEIILSEDDSSPSQGKMNLDI